MKAGPSLLLLLLLACSAARPPSYVDAERAALRAYSAGRYAEAARHWLAAVREAEAERDRDEARYRAAASHARAGELERAEALYRELARGDGERAPSAALGQVELAERAGDAERASELRLALLRRHPSSGAARSALREEIAVVKRSGGTKAALALLQSLFQELAGSALDERLRYERARLLDEAGQTEQALAAYVEVAGAHPYPAGALWDDALFRGADTARKLGRPALATELLERLLAEREEAHTVGSYERSRYAEARFRLAEIYRDDLADPIRARHEFHRVWLDHTTSLLRDDALFEEALIARRTGDSAAACDTLRLLASQLPESRFAPCAGALCGQGQKPAGTCRAYIQRRWTEAAASRR